MANISATLPSPEFFDKMEQLSTKKERGTSQRKPPPLPPVKSAPRRFHIHNASSHKALAVSFQNTDNSVLSKYYNERSPRSYFSQCFQVLGLLGKGSFGEVYEVRSLEDNKRYAIKKSIMPFRGEFDRLRKLEEVKKHELLPVHPHCIKFIKAWEEEQFLYIQTELCKTSLKDFTEIYHDIPEKLVWKYLVDLLLAVKHLHDNNLVHMDIKPDNIFISESCICKLGDFGLVLDFAKSDISEAIEGDPKYLAPELMDGKFTKAADIFSLGITLLELACDLDLPMGGSSWHDLRRGRIPPEFTSHISQDLKNVICGMMTADFRLRPSIDKILAHHTVARVLRRRRCEIFFKQMFITMMTVIFAFIAVIENIFLWPWRTYVDLVNRSKSNSEFDDVNEEESMDIKTPPIAMELSFSDGDDLEEDKRTNEMSNDSINFGVELSHSTPVIARQRSTAQRSNLMRSDHVVSDNSYSYSPSLDDSIHRSQYYSKNEDVNNHSLILPRNLTEMFDSLSDND